MNDQGANKTEKDKSYHQTWSEDDKIWKQAIWKSKWIILNKSHEVQERTGLTSYDKTLRLLAWPGMRHNKLR